MENKTLNRPRLREMVFQNAEALEKINQIMHPKVREEFEKRKREHAQEKIIFLTFLFYLKHILKISVKKFFLSMQTEKYKSLVLCNETEVLVN
ncbi:hypothetical protein HMPREF9466_00027 [Fusobacterium necrophorum subsp. funduliforme 1_1_36S]|nr:hypothetical protein HMPREF9466_00027 [Fusobacterium necrophorum subsp. funduliforme 1_1_36S]